MSKIQPNFLKKIDFFIIIILLGLYIGIRLINFFNVPPVQMYDTGNYLYAGRLIAQGYIPYKDFAVGHMPFYLYFISLLWRVGFDLKTIQVIHLVLTSLVIFPLYSIVRYFTLHRIFAILACSFIIFSPHLFYFSRIVILDPIIMLFIIGTFYFYFCSKSKYKELLSGILLGLAVSVKITAFISLFCLMLGLFIFSNKKRGEFLKPIAKVILGFSLITIPLFVWLFSIPNFFEDLFIFHLFKQIDMTWIQKLSIFLFYLKKESVLLFLGLLASLFALLIIKNKDIKTLAFYNISGVIISLAGFRTFYEQHLVQFMPGLVIVLCLFVYFLCRLVKSKLSFVLVPILFSFYALVWAYPVFYTEYQRTNLIENEIVNILKSTSGYLYTATPYFALKSQKKLYPWYFVALSDSAARNKVSSEVLNKVIIKSNTVLLDSRAQRQLPKETLAFIYRHFKPVYQKGEYTILEK